MLQGHRVSSEAAPRFGRHFKDDARAGRRALGAIVVVALTASGCGTPPPSEDLPLTRIASTTVDGVIYTINGARELDPSDPGERVYLEGRTPPSDSPLLGVFLVVCNATGGAVNTVEDLQLIGPSGPVGSRVSLKGNRVAYEARELSEGECAPAGQTLPARVGPGLLALFEVPEGILGERPLRLAIESARGEEGTLPVKLEKR